MCSLYNASLIYNCDIINLFASTFSFIVQMQKFYLSHLYTFHINASIPPIPWPSGSIATFYYSFISMSMNSFVNLFPPAVA
jgi:hypothetical protein